MTFTQKSEMQVGLATYVERVAWTNNYCRWYFVVMIFVKNLVENYFGTRDALDSRISLHECRRSFLDVNFNDRKLKTKKHNIELLAIDLIGDFLSNKTSQVNRFFRKYGRERSLRSVDQCVKARKTR